MRVWGVTGTNGKTTTTWILAEFIGAAEGRRCGYVTTVEAFTGARRFATGYTTPPYARLVEIFAEMEANGCTDCAMEVSSHAIHQRRTGETVFAGGAFTNLTEDHLDYHKTMAEYFRVKASFARQIAESHWHGRTPPPALGRGDFPPYVVCLDGGGGREMLAACGAWPLNVRPVTVAKPRFDLAGLQLAGDYNRSNVLVAAELAEAAGVPHATIQSVIPALRPRWGRLERVATASAAEVYVDFAHTPDGLEKVLAAARGFCRGRLWAVFGAGGDRDPFKRPLMGAAVARTADFAVVTSDNPRGEKPEAIIAAVMAGVEEGRKAAGARLRRVWAEVDRRAAIARALAGAESGDVVLVCGKGHETTQEIMGVRHPFDDREECRRWGVASGGKIC